MTLPAPFIPPMLCERLTDPRRLADRGYIAEPKLDGQRAQLHVQAGRATACYSRRGLDLGKRIEWGDWGEAVMLGLAYEHPRSGKPMHIRQAVRIARAQPFALRIGGHAELVCWGVMPSGMLRHPLFSRWSDDRPRPPRT